MPKLCPKCKRTLNESEFNWKVKGVKLAVHCKDCSRRYIREHYWENRDYYLGKVHRRNLELKKKCNQYIGSFLLTHPCIDCGEKNILVLEFDHRVRKDKTDNIGKMISRKMCFERVVEEIAKCDVRCSNCHRIKTARESGSWKLKYAPVA